MEKIEYFVIVADEYETDVQAKLPAINDTFSVTIINKTKARKLKNVGDILGRQFVAWRVVRQEPEPLWVRAMGMELFIEGAADRDESEELCSVRRAMGGLKGHITKLKRKIEELQQQQAEEPDANEEEENKESMGLNPHWAERIASVEQRCSKELEILRKKIAAHKERIRELEQEQGHGNGDEANLEWAVKRLLAQLLLLGVPQEMLDLLLRAK